MRKDLTQDQIKGMLNYNPSTGRWTWAVSRGSVAVGRSAGSLDADGYLIIKINRESHKALDLHGFTFMENSQKARLII